MNQHHRFIPTLAMGALVYLHSALEGLAQQPGRLDPSFDPEIVSGTVSDAVLQPDGKWIVGGFVTFHDRTDSVSLFRLWPDGSLDRSFRASASLTPKIIALQPDGRVLVSYAFEGGAWQTVVRLESDGSMDRSFRVEGIKSISGVTLVEPSVLALQPDGRVLVGGSNLEAGGNRGLVRLNRDGSLDPSFMTRRGFSHVSPNATNTGSLMGLVPQQDGKVVVVGGFTSFNEVPRHSILRLRSDGSLDEDFNPASWLWTAEGVGERAVFVSAVAAGTGGRLYLAAISGGSGEPIVRSVVCIDPDGSKVASFQITPVATDVPSSLAVQPDGRVVVGGPGGIARLKAGGGVDEPFETEPQSNLILSRRKVMLTEDGHIAVAGVSAPVQPFAKLGLARLFGATVKPFPAVVLHPPQGQQVVAGAQILLSVAASAHPPADIQWYRDGTPLSGQTRRSLLIKKAAPTDAGFYHAVLSNPAGQTSTEAAFVPVASAPTLPGSVDLTFDPEEIPDVVRIHTRDLAPLPNGGVVVARYVKFASGQETSEIVRFDASGRIDPDFRVTVAQATNVFPFIPRTSTLLTRIQLQPDGKMLVLGEFDSIAGVNRGKFVRLHADGSLDEAFNPVFGPVSSFLPALIVSFDIDSVSRILVSGRFISVNGTARTNVARLFPDGSLDADFDPMLLFTGLTDAGRTAPMSSVQVLKNGNVLTGGTVQGFIQVRADGTLDEAFGRQPRGSTGAQRSAEQANGSLLVRVGTLTIGNQQRQDFALFSPNGLLVTSFDPKVDGHTGGFAVGDDDKVFLGGTFRAVNGVPREGLARLWPDGSLDLDFDPGTGVVESPSTGVWQVVPTSDGKLWVGGGFDRFNGFRRQGIVRLHGGEVLRLRSARLANDRLTFKARTRPNTSYQLEFREALTHGEWVPVKTIAGNGGEMSFEDAAAPAAQRFYRLREM